MYCDKCGHELQGFSLICPCCGGTYGEPEPDAPVEDEKPAEDEKPVEDEKPAEQEQPAGQTPPAEQTAPGSPVFIGVTNGFAIAGIIFAFLLPPLGLVISSIGLKRSDSTGGEGKGLSVAGMVISTIFTLVIYVAFAAVFVVAYAVALALGEAFGEAFMQILTGGTETAEALFAAVPFI